MIIRTTVDPQEFLSPLLWETWGTCTQSPFFDIISMPNFCLHPHNGTLWKQLSWEFNKETGSCMENAKTFEKNKFDR